MRRAYDFRLCGSSGCKPAAARAQGSTACYGFARPRRLRRTGAVLRAPRLSRQGARSAAGRTCRARTRSGAVREQAARRTWTALERGRGRRAGAARPRARAVPRAGRPRGDARRPSCRGSRVVPRPVRRSRARDVVHRRCARASCSLSARPTPWTGPDAGVDFYPRQGVVVTGATVLLLPRARRRPHPPRRQPPPGRLTAGRARAPGRRYAAASRAGRRPPAGSDGSRGTGSRGS